MQILVLESSSKIFDLDFHQIHYLIADSPVDGIYELGIYHINRIIRKLLFVFAKTNAQISCTVTAQLIRAFIFAT